MASTMKVAVMYAMKQVIKSSMELVTGPSATKPSGYVNGPVASNKLTIVADAARGDIGFTELVVYGSMIS